jgi:streptogramin lyase
MTLSPGGDLWFTIESSLKVGMVNPRTHAIATFSLPPGGFTLGGIVSGPDGDLWITENQVFGGAIEQLNPVTHAVREYAIAARGATPGAITVGPDGNLWFTDGQATAGSIGKLNRRTHAITEFRLPFPATLGGITAGPDGNIWFTEMDRAQIGVLDPTTGAIRLFPAPFIHLDSPAAITTGPDGNMWFTEATDTNLPAKIGVVTVGSGPAQQATCSAAHHAGTAKTQHCRLTPSHGAVNFPAGAAIAHLTRAGTLYASGSAKSRHGALRLMLVPQHRLTPGTYGLALTVGGHTRHEALIVT